MRIIIKLRTQSDLNLSPHYGEVIQGFLYHAMDRVLATRVHDQGFTAGTRAFRLFTFSRLEGRSTYNQARKLLTFPQGSVLAFHVASCQDELMENFVRTMLVTEQVRLGAAPCSVEGIEVAPQRPLQPGPIAVQTLSPITVYSTELLLNGRKRTHYYNPLDAEWEGQILGNLTRKAAAAGWDSELLALQPMSVQPLRVGPRDRKVATYRGTVIEAWMGTYLLDLPPALLQFVLDTGLGSKNAQGFGMVEEIDA